VIEDNAHGLLGEYRGRDLGTFGCLATLSFHETKNFTCGEGGALLVNRSDWIERAEIIREKGTDRNRFFRGQVDKYTWVDHGSSYLPSEMLAAFLYGQLEGRERVQTRRIEIWRRYHEELCEWAAERGVGLPSIPAHCAHPSHLFYLILPSFESRARLIDHLADNGILAVFHYQPLHLSKMGRRFGGHPGLCPVTENVSDRLLRLPLYWGLTEAEQAQVIEALRRFDPR
jgi:dTDP-4-amino-4,6-dideoxygalactose transaminase